MDAARQTGTGTVIDERLAPAGLTGLLGNHGARRPILLVTAGALFAAACAVLVLVPSPPVTVGLVFIVPVSIIASELGARAGLISALMSIGAVLGWMAAGMGEEGPTAVAPRSLALLFVAWIIGRTSDRAARSRELLHKVLEATTDAIDVKDLDGRYLLVSSATAQLIDRPGSEILGSCNAELLPEVASEIATQDAAVLERLAPSTYEMSGHFGERRCPVRHQEPLCDGAGTPVATLGIARDITEQRRLQERFRRGFSGRILGCRFRVKEACRLELVRRPLRTNSERVGRECRFSTKGALSEGHSLSRPRTAPSALSLFAASGRLPRAPPNARSGRTASVRATVQHAPASGGKRAFRPCRHG